MSSEEYRAKEKLYEDIAAELKIEQQVIGIIKQMQRDIAKHEAGEMEMADVEDRKWLLRDRMAQGSVQEREQNVREMMHRLFELEEWLAEH